MTQISKSQTHPYHLVDPSLWPLVASCGALFTTLGGVLYMHSYSSGFVLLLGLTLIIFTMFTWWRDIIREATFELQHTTAVQTGMRYGMILFVASEVMFFFAFFWAFFHASLAPTPDIGSSWPPAGIDVLNAFEIPLLNTIILLTSGATVTWAHHAIVAQRKNDALIGLLLTIILAVFFTAVQGFEYVTASFRMCDSVYGSTFYMATGFHGFHVFIGTCFLTVCLVRLYYNQYTENHHFGFEAAAIYWHFVDVVWLFLFCCVYWWGGA